MFAVFFGVVGATISSSKEIENFLDQIHKHASGNKKNSNSVQEVIGNLLTHHGDAIDIPSGVDSFINRRGDNSYGLFHYACSNRNNYIIGSDRLNISSI